MNSSPLVSICICTYNHENFIRDCLESAVRQDYSHIEILVSDDASSDRTKEVIDEYACSYIGPHKLIVNNNENNMGAIRNFQKLVRMASGEFILGLAGDDIAFPQRVSTLVREWEKSGRQLKGIFSNAVYTDEYGNRQGLYFKDPPLFTSSIEEFASSKMSVSHIFQPYVWALGATSMWDKTLFFDYEEMDARVIQEDGVLSFRALLSGGLGYVHSPLLYYRRHSSAISNPKNFKNRQKMLVNEQYYFDMQLTDAKRKNACNEVIIRVKYFRRWAIVKRIIFGIPFLGQLFLIISVGISSVIKKRIMCKRHSR